MNNNIDYSKVCFKLVDKLNDCWRKKYGKSKNEYKYTFEFLPANAVNMYYVGGLVAQISYATPIGFFQVVQSDINGLFPHGCNTPDEAFKSMVDNYLKLVKENCLFFGNETQDYPKTISEILE